MLPVKEGRIDLYFIAIRQDARTVGSHKVSVDSSATSVVYLGFWKEGTAGTCVDEEA